MTPRQPRVTADEIIKVLKSIGFDYMSALLHFTLCSLRYALCFYSPPPPFHMRNRYFLKRRWRKIAVNSKELTLCCMPQEMRIVNSKELTPVRELLGLSMVSPEFRIPCRS